MAASFSPKLSIARSKKNDLSGNFRVKSSSLVTPVSGGKAYETTAGYSCFYQGTYQAAMPLTPVPTLIYIYIYIKKVETIHRDQICFLHQDVNWLINSPAFFNTVFYSVSLSFGVSHKWLWTVVFGTSTTAPLFHLQGFQLSHLICFVVLLALLRSATVITFTKSVM